MAMKKAPAKAPRKEALIVMEDSQFIVRHISRSGAVGIEAAKKKYGANNASRAISHMLNDFDRLVKSEALHRTARREMLDQLRQVYYLEKSGDDAATKSTEILGALFSEAQKHVHLLND